MARPTKAELRDRILELGGDTPPGSWTRAQLEAHVDTLEVAAGSDAGARPSRASLGTATGGPRPPAQPPRCAGGRPLHTHVCRQCHLLRLDACPMDKS